jgi:hypothetical protein
LARRIPPAAPADQASRGGLQSASASVSYGWGCIPVTARLGGTTWSTSLFPKDDRYLVPLKVAVAKAEGVDLGDAVQIRLAIAI